MTELMIAKVGGSLYDMPDLGLRLRRWLEQQEARQVLLVPGGGAAADVIRELDRQHQLGQEAAHWLALRMLQVNAHFLASVLPGAAVAASPSERAPLAVLDGFAFALSDDANPERLPHAWAATSDSLALRAAVVAEAAELVLLKSISWQGDDWQSAADQGIVDAHFATLARRHPDLTVRVVNLRSWLPDR